MEKVIWVAGASSGLGKATAECLAQNGHTVYAAARSFAGNMKAPAGCEKLYLDVTDEKSVQAALKTILQKHGRLDALIYCAATFTMSPLEELPVSTLDSMMNVNFLGMARCVQAALPVMRQQQSGQIVLFSSLNGLFSIPFQGAYSATKRAIEAYGQALQQETRAFGIHVTLVEPGDCRGGSQKYRAAHLCEDSPYTAFFRAGTQKIHHDEENGLPPEKVGRAVCRLLNNKRPPAYLVVASLTQRSAAWMHAFLPRRWFNRIIESYYK